MAGILSYEPPVDHKVTDNFGYVFSVEDASRLRNENTTKFSCYNADKSFGNIGKYRKEVFQQDYLQ